MKIKYHTQTLKKILTDLTALTGVSFEFVDKDFKKVVNSLDMNDYCSVLQKKDTKINPCRFSDTEILNKCKISRNLEQHICHAGLCDFAMPIIKNDIIVGYVIFGRIRTVKTKEPKNFTNDTSANNRLEKLFYKLPYFSEEQINCLTDLLPRILFANAIEIENNSPVEEITEYINNNLQSELNINLLCKKFLISKNRLYQLFLNNFNTTVNGYITDQRIKKAKEMLKETNETVYEIANLIGLNNYTYFCKLFKKETGLTPTQYRNAPQI